MTTETVQHSSPTRSACPGTRSSSTALRFSKIALPEQTITTRLWDAGEHEGRSAYAYETQSEAGDVVIKDGWAEIA
jgi:hypothetical protein